MRPCVILKGWMAMLSMAIGACASPLALRVDEDTAWIPPDAQRHVVRIYLENTGFQTIGVLGGTFGFLVDDGSGSLGMPSVESVRLIGLEGGLFTPGNAVADSLRLMPGHVQVVLVSLPFFPATEVAIPPLSVFPFAEVTLDVSSVGTGPGPWTLSAWGPPHAPSAFDRIDPSDPSQVDVLVVAGGPVLLRQRVGIDPGVVAWLQDDENTLRLQFLKGAGTTVLLEFCEDLREAQWKPVPASMMSAEGAGGMLEWRIDVSPGIPHRFFRILEHPAR